MWKLDEKSWKNCRFLSNFSNFDFESLPFSLIFFKVTVTGGNPCPNFLLAFSFGMFANIFGFPGTLKKFQSIDKPSLCTLIEVLFS